MVLCLHAGYYVCMCMIRSGQQFRRTIFLHSHIHFTVALTCGGIQIANIPLAFGIALVTLSVA